MMASNINVRSVWRAIQTPALCWDTRNLFTMVLCTGVTFVRKLSLMAVLSQDTRRNYIHMTFFQSMIHSIIFDRSFACIYVCSSQSLNVLCYTSLPTLLTYNTQVIISDIILTMAGWGGNSWNNFGGGFGGGMRGGGNMGRGVSRRPAYPIPRDSLGQYLGLTAI